MFKKQLVSDATSIFLTNISISLERIEKEQIHNRIDIANIMRFLKRIHNNLELQQQVDKYFDQDETSPQTELEDK